MLLSRLCLLCTNDTELIVHIDNRPISLFWTLQIGSETCLNESTLTTSWGVINTVWDFVIVILPMSSIWKLKMPKQRRIAVVGLLGVGTAVSFAGVARAYFMFQVTKVKADKTWETSPELIAAMVETNLGMVSLNLLKYL
jgi:hypothetical protein